MQDPRAEQVSRGTIAAVVLGGVAVGAVVGGLYWSDWELVVYAPVFMAVGMIFGGILSAGSWVVAVGIFVVAVAMLARRSVSSTIMGGVMLAASLAGSNVLGGWIAVQ